MIDEERTMHHFGYTSDSLSHGSGKLIMVECDICGVVMERTMSAYNTVTHPDLCYSCRRVELYGDPNSVVRIPPDKVDEASEEYKQQQAEIREAKVEKKEAMKCGMWNHEKCRRWTDEEIMTLRKDLYMNPKQPRYYGFPHGEEKFPHIYNHDYGNRQGEEVVKHIHDRECRIDADRSIDWVATYKRFGYTYTDPQHFVVVCESCGERCTTITPYIPRAPMCVLCYAAEVELRWLDSWYRKVEKNECDILTRYKNGWVDTRFEASFLGASENSLRSALVRLCGRLPKDVVSRRRSATMQGIPYEEWTEYATEQKYCSKFNESLKRAIREKYDNKCFLCGKPQSDNITTVGQQKALSVHHVDMNKDQGCDEHDWSLVPLCLHCHGGAHSKMWQARIEYLLDNVWA
jgi:hypothetical protein